MVGILLFPLFFGIDVTLWRDSFGLNAPWLIVTYFVFLLFIAVDVNKYYSSIRKDDGVPRRDVFVNGIRRASITNAQYLVVVLEVLRSKRYVTKLLIERVVELFLIFVGFLVLNPVLWYWRLVASTTLRDALEPYLDYLYAPIIIPTVSLLISSGFVFVLRPLIRGDHFTRSCNEAVCDKYVLGARGDIRIKRIKKRDQVKPLVGSYTDAAKAAASKEGA